MVEAEYELDESDLVALARFQVERSPIVRRRFYIQWFGYFIGFSLCGLGNYLAYSSTPLPLTFAGLAVLSLIVFPLYFRWANERRIRRLVRERATPSSLSKRVLRITPEGLEQTMESQESKAKWDLVDDVVETPTHAFISVDGAFSIIIPGLRLGEDQFRGFVDAVRAHAKITPK